MSCVLFAALTGVLLAAVFALRRRAARARRRRRSGQRRAVSVELRRCQPKPAWVRREIIRLKALIPGAGCRSLAEVFNRRHGNAHRMTVGKTFVGDVIRTHRYEILLARRQLKHRVPRAMSRNRIWAIDLTGKQDAAGKVHSVLGILDHGSRANLALSAVPDKASITLLRVLLAVFERYGMPRAVRTDNEAVFTSRLFRFGLWWLGIRHETIDPHCPWQNGRVERFFGTLKAKLDHWSVASVEELGAALAQFRFWYNHVRPHQHLGGRTPAEVWAGRDRPVGKPQWVTAWDGLLSGDYYAPS